jgi:tetratricopeptide (TPR) repeat protein
MAKKRLVYFRAVIPILYGWAKNVILVPPLIRGVRGVRCVAPQNRSGITPFIKYIFLAISVTLCIGLGQVVNVRSTNATNSATAMQPPSVVAVASPVDTTIQNLPNLTGLMQQGRDLYETGKFAEAAKIWQQAAQAFQSQGDQLNQAIAFSFLSLAYQQLGQWDEAGGAMTGSLQLLKDAGLQPPKSDFGL